MREFFNPKENLKSQKFIKYHTDQEDYRFLNYLRQVS